MLESADYRNLLLTIVDAFLEGTPNSLARAHSLADTLLPFRDRKPWITTLDTMVWGGYVLMLSDRVFFESEEFLCETRTLLSQGAPDIHRAYLNYDFRPKFTAAEHEWLEHLLHLLTLLREWRSTTSETHTEAYDRHVAAIAALSPHILPPTTPGDETLHHFILRHVSEVLTHIHLGYSATARRLTPTAPCTSFGGDDPYRPRKHKLNVPDATTSVEWADKALRAITHRGWLFITWQVTATSYHITVR